MWKHLPTATTEYNINKPFLYANSVKVCKWYRSCWDKIKVLGLNVKWTECIAYIYANNINCKSHYI